MDKTIFDFQDYKRYLRYLITQRKARGFQAQLADRLRVQRAFVSQVFNKDIHFSLEHAEEINRFLNHGEEEGGFFIHLVSLARAGTKSLKEHFRRELNSILKRRLTLKNRIQVDKNLSHEDQSQYYSSWIYSAIHMATALPTLNTVESLTRYFRVPNQKVIDVVNFLLSRNLVIEKSGVLALGSAHLYINNDDSQMVAKHHTNWRVHAITSLINEGPRDLHYSSVVSLSKDDALELKNFFIKCMESSQKKIKESKEEVLYSLALDFYEI